MMKTHRQRRRSQRDPIEDYREWADNRYNPGHWLGGNVPPSLRNLWSPKDRRWLGAIYVGVSAIGFAIIVWNGRSAEWDSILLAVLVLVPMLVPGLIMLFAKDTPDDAS